MKAISVNGLNVVYMDEEVKNNGVHDFKVKSVDGTELLEVNYQCGARHMEGSTDGVLDEDLLAMVKERMKAFQNSEFACRENDMVLMHVEEAMMWLQKRAKDRADRGVLGTYNK